MPNDDKEPESYGESDSQRADFYNQGGSAGREDDEDETMPKVSSQPTGAKRDSYFKRRDY